MYQHDGTVVLVGYDSRSETMRSFYHLVFWQQWLTRDQSLPVGYADGHFFLYNSYDGQFNLINEVTGQITDATSRSSLFSNMSVNDWVTFARTDDELYMRVYKANTASHTVMRVNYGSSLELYSVNHSSGQSEPRTNLLERDGLIYYGMPNDAAGPAQVYAYDPEINVSVTLFALDDFNRYELFHSDDYLYAVPYETAGIIYRYSFADRQTRQTPVRSTTPSVTLTDGGLIMDLNDYNNDRDLGAYQIYLLDDTEEKPRLISDDDQVVGINSNFIFGPLSDDEVLYRDHSDEFAFEWKRHNGKTGQSRTVDRAGAQSVNSLRGTGLRFSTRGIGGDRYFTYLDGAIEPLMDTRTNDTLKVGYPDYNYSYGRQFFVSRSRTQNANEQVDLVHYAIAGKQATPTVLAENVKITQAGYTAGYVYFIVTRGGSTFDLAIIDDRTGALLYDRELPAGAYRVVGVTERGFWTAEDGNDYGSTFGNSYGVSFHPFDGSAPVGIPLPQDVALFDHNACYTLGDRLVFAHATPSGVYLWAVDAASGSVAALPARPFTTDNYSDFFARQVAGTLYFTHRTDSPTRRTLWRTDGTIEGTYLVSENIDPLVGLWSGYSNTVFDGRLYLQAAGPQGNELYAIDPTDDDVSLVMDINPGTGSSRPRNMFAASGGLYFIASTSDAAAPQVYFLSGLSTSTYQPRPTVALTLFPNPTTERATLTVPDDHSLHSVEIIDNLGRRLLQQTAGGQQTELDLHRLVGGTYHVVTTFTDGQRGYGKLVVER